MCAGSKPLIYDEHFHSKSRLAGRRSTEWCLTPSAYYWLLLFFEVLKDFSGPCLTYYKMTYIIELVGPYISF